MGNVTSFYNVLNFSMNNLEYIVKNDLVSAYIIARNQMIYS